MGGAEKLCSLVPTVDAMELHTHTHREKEREREREREQRGGGGHKKLSQSQGEREIFYSNSSMARFENVCRVTVFVCVTAFL